MERIVKLWRKIWGVPYVRHLLVGMGLLFVLFFGVFVFLRFYTRHGVEFAVCDYQGLSRDSARMLARKQGVRLEVVDSMYLITCSPGEVVGQYPAAGSKIKKGRRVFLTVNSLSAQRVPVPNVVGTSLRQALMDLERVGLTVGKLTFTPDIAVNSVLGQSYEGRPYSVGDSLPKGSEVDLCLGKSFEPSFVSLPMLQGLSLREARYRVAEASLNLGTLYFDSTVKTFVDSLSAKVYSVRPLGESPRRLAPGTPVDLWLTLNSARIGVDAP